MSRGFAVALVIIFPIMTEEFDLRETLAGRAYPTSTIKVWMDEEVMFEIAALIRKQANITDPKELKAIDAQISATTKEANDQAYTVHLRGTSRRAREDMQSKAFAEFPIERDIYGREKDMTAWNRGNLLTEMYFAAHITAVVNPAGKRQDWTEENRRDLARVLLDMAPEETIKMIDAAILALRGDEEMQKGVDFLSRT